MPVVGSRAAGSSHDRFSCNSSGLRLGRNSRIGVKPASCSTNRWIVMSVTVKLVCIAINPYRRGTVIVAAGHRPDNAAGLDRRDLAANPSAVRISDRGG